MNQLLDMLIFAPPILLALTFHEYSHAYVANRLGDPTAKLMGRLTLNPLVHLDLLGTAMLFIVHIGWAKPVPVNPGYFKNPRRDMLWVSLAGPASNLLLALLFGLMLRGIGLERLSANITILVRMIWYGLYINIILAVFNLLPIPPLDGSKILAGLIPREYEEQIAPFFKYGPTILIGLIVFGYVTGTPILWYMINPFVSFFSYLFAGIQVG